MIFASGAYVWLEAEEENYPRGSQKRKKKEKEKREREKKRRKEERRVAYSL